MYKSAALVAIFTIGIVQIQCQFPLFDDDDVGLGRNIFKIQDDIVSSAPSKKPNQNKPTVIRSEQRKPNGWSRQEIVYNIKPASPETEEDNDNFDEKFNNFEEFWTEPEEEVSWGERSYADRREEETKTKSKKTCPQTKPSVEPKKSTIVKESKSKIASKPEKSFNRKSKLKVVDIEEDDQMDESIMQLERLEKEKMKKVASKNANHQKNVERQRTPRPTVEKEEIPFESEEEEVPAYLRAESKNLRGFHSADEEEEEEEEDRFAQKNPEPLEIYTVTVGGRSPPYVYAVDLDSEAVYYLGRFNIRK